VDAKFQLQGWLEKFEGEFKELHLPRREEELKKPFKVGEEREDVQEKKEKKSPTKKIPPLHSTT